MESNLHPAHNVNTTFNSTDTSSTYSQEVEWILTTPSLILGFVSLVCLFVVHRANKLDQMQILLSGPAEIKKRSNDYFILSLLNALILSDTMFIGFVSGNYIPYAFDTGVYSNTVCIIIAMGVQLFSLYSFCWHLMLSCYLLALLVNPKFEFDIKILGRKDRSRPISHYNYNYYNFNQITQSFCIVQMFLLSFCIICTIIPINDYGSFYIYYDNNDNKYSKQCWVDEHNRFDLIVYVFGIIIAITQDIVFIYALYKLHKVNTNSKLNSNSNLNTNTNTNTNSTTSIININNNTRGSVDSNDSKPLSSLPSNAPSPKTIPIVTRSSKDLIGNFNNINNLTRTGNVSIYSENEMDSALIMNRNNNILTQGINTSAYKHIIIQLSHWVLIYGIYCIIAGTQRVVHFISLVFTINSNGYDSLLLAIMHNWGVMTLGIVDGIIWLLSKLTLRTYKYEKMIQHQRLLHMNFYEYEKEKHKAYRQIELAKQKDNIIMDGTTTSNLVNAIPAPHSHVTSFGSNDR